MVTDASVGGPMDAVRTSRNLASLHDFGWKSAGNGVGAVDSDGWLIPERHAVVVGELHIVRRGGEPGKRIREPTGDQAVHKVHPGKMLAYNCSPSFNWKKNLDNATIAKFQKELGLMGYKYQFITLAGIHSMWYNMFDLAQDYVARGMTAYIEKVQEPEFAARSRGYTFVSHQQEVGTGYFDEVTTVIQGGKSSVTALTGSTEEEQFH